MRDMLSLCLSPCERYDVSLSVSLYLHMRHMMSLSLSLSPYERYDVSLFVSLYPCERYGVSLCLSPYERYAVSLSLSPYERYDISLSLSLSLSPCLSLSVCLYLLPPLLLGWRRRKVSLFAPCCFRLGPGVSPSAFFEESACSLSPVVVASLFLGSTLQIVCRRVRYFRDCRSSYRMRMSQEKGSTRSLNSLGNNGRYQGRRRHLTTQRDRQRHSERDRETYRDRQIERDR